jgi:hypothetical protein
VLVRGQVSHLYKTTGKIIVLCILTFKFLQRTVKDKRFQTERHQAISIFNLFSVNCSWQQRTRKGTKVKCIVTHVHHETYREHGGKTSHILNLKIIWKLCGQIHVLPADGRSSIFSYGIIVNSYT